MIVATETGILHRMEQENPSKTFIPANRAAVCRYMKMITLPGLRDALRDMKPEVKVPPSIARRASTSRSLSVRIITHRIRCCHACVISSLIR